MEEKKDSVYGILSEMREFAKSQNSLTDGMRDTVLDWSDRLESVCFKLEKSILDDFMQKSADIVKEYMLENDKLRKSLEPIMEVAEGDDRKSIFDDNFARMCVFAVRQSANNMDKYGC